MIRWTRLFKHAVATPLSVRRQFNAAALEAITKAIGAAEQHTTGELRFAVEAALPWSYLWRDAPVRQRALMVFSKLRVWDTEQNNGVLVYLEFADRAVEIVADRGIARCVSQEKWDRIALTLREHLRQGQSTAAVVAAIEATGKLLNQHFPLAAGQRDTNELSDKPVLL